MGGIGTLFLISGDVSSGFQSQSGVCLIHLFYGGECNVHSLRSTSGAAPADFLTASIAAGHFLTCISRGGTWLRFEQAITRTEDERATRLTYLILVLIRYKPLLAHIQAFKYFILLYLIFLPLLFVSYGIKLWWNYEILDLLSVNGYINIETMKF